MGAESPTKGWHAYRHRLLTVGLLAVMTVRPLLAHGFLSNLILEGSAAGLLLAFLYLAAPRGRPVLIAGFLWLLAIVGALTLYEVWNEEAIPARHALGTLCVGFSLVFFSYVCAVILRRIMSDDTVTVDSVFGAVAVYLMLGLIWTNLYMLVFLTDANAFAGLSAEGVHPDTPAAYYHYSAALSYFSLTTLTTLGFGDVRPVAPMARTFAWMEAAIGQLYLAVMVARLVALETAELIRERPRRREPPAGGGPGV